MDDAHNRNMSDTRREDSSLQLRFRVQQAEHHFTVLLRDGEEERCLALVDPGRDLHSRELTVSWSILCHAPKQRTCLFYGILLKLVVCVSCQCGTVSGHRIHWCADFRRCTDKFGMISGRGANGKELAGGFNYKARSLASSFILLQLAAARENDAVHLQHQVMLYSHHRRPAGAHPHPPARPRLQAIPQVIVLLCRGDDNRHEVQRELRILERVPPAALKFAAQRHEHVVDQLVALHPRRKLQGVGVEAAELLPGLAAGRRPRQM
jgi:hypothetical protein